MHTMDADALPRLVHGVDLVEVARLARALGDGTGRFASRVFTEDELAYAAARPRRRDEHLAARFAAKEAVLKALGTGWSDGIAWTDVETRRDGDGPPTVQLRGRAAEVAASLGVRRWALSLTHTSTHAVASVIGW
jgi:holo-[acyl-carrier protein] synthase